MSIILNMFFASGILQICLLLLTSTSVNGYSIGTVEKLTKCSKYDFEEKLLERLVRLEHSIELERKLKQFEDKLGEKVIKMESVNSEKLNKIEHANSEKLKTMEQTNSEKLKQMEHTNSEKLKQMEHTHSEKMEEMKISMNEMLKRLDEEDIRRNNSFHSLREEYVKERSRQKSVLNEEMQDFTVNSQDIINKITENNNNSFKTFERNVDTQNRKFKESVADMNTTFTSFLTTIKHKAVNQQQTLADVMHDVKLNTTLTNEKLLDQQKKNKEQLLSFIKTESSKNKAFERNMNTQNKKLKESVADMNTTFTSFLETAKHKAEKQQQSLVDIMHDVKLNTSLTKEKLLDQQKKNNETLRSFIETESSKNKVSMTACAQHKSYSGGDSVLFPHIHTRNGISSKVISSLKYTGIFTCEKTGLYLISIFVSTDEHPSVIYLYKNSTKLARLSYSFNGYSQTNSATVLENLTVGDTLTVKSFKTMFIYSDRRSCMSILQLTN